MQIANKLITSKRAENTDANSSSFRAENE